MVFRRRDKRSLMRIIADFFWPRGGWGRAFHYVKHRIRRLPDAPDRIARGIWAGVFSSFTPFFGFHFLIAGLLGWIMRGNILAALMSTFFGNPVTFVLIATVSMRLGHWILGTHFEEQDASLGEKFKEAAGDLWFNFTSIFTDRTPDWHGLAVFYDEVFLPYLVGGLVPGVICATTVYLIALPLINVYQKRRRAKIKAKFEAIRQRAEYEAVNSPHPPSGSQPPSGAPQAGTAD